MLQPFASSQCSNRFPCALDKAARKRIALVVPRFGPAIRGGAETFAFSIAQRLSDAYEVDVLTTCAREYKTWKNEFVPGLSREGEINVRRFPVERERDGKRFDRLSTDIRDRLPAVSRSEQDNWMREQGPFSPQLLGFIESHHADYAAFLFLPYLYATTYFGLPLIAHKALLLPLLHDEWMLSLPAWDALFHGARARAYLTEAERRSAIRRFGSDRADGTVIGSGFDWQSGDAQRFRERFLIHDPFMFYLGRVDESKGCAELVRFFEMLGGDTQFASLVLAGPLAMKSPAAQRVHVLGEIDETSKWDALAACELFVMPSRYESLSIAVLEAWSCAKPVLVSGFSAVLVEHCKRGNGGLWYRNDAEFRRAVQTMDRPTRKILGEQGKEYVRANFDWTQTIEALSEQIERVATS